ncbi:MAG: maleylpyruvate isomerase N-terminal domain-containing protein, partial [Acidimicrobiales bacterium]|nr:maleylpyruvate isomerase N-terminal domain-containing protein [Acidimicrobiales bacterium]
MRPDRYLDLVEQDGRRLAEVAAAGDLDAPIPSCPGWAVRDCVVHTGEVY